MLYNINNNNYISVDVVRDSSAVWRLLWICCSRGTSDSESNTYGKQRIYFSNSGSAHFHVSWLSDFIFYQKPLYKSLHRSFFFSFITFLPSESGVTLHFTARFCLKSYNSAICLPFFKHLPRDYEKTTIIVWYSWPLGFFCLISGSGNGWIHVFNGGRHSE